MPGAATAGEGKAAAEPRLKTASGAAAAAQQYEAQVAADKATLEYTQKALDDCNVVAPISGVVLERNVEVGDFVAAEGGRGAIANSDVAKSRSR